MNPLNSSSAQANGAGGPKVTYLTNPVCGVAIHICQGSEMWDMQGNSIADSP